jgi:hypothetical protein
LERPSRPLSSAGRCRAGWPDGRAGLLIIEILESIAIDGDSEIARIEAIKLLLGVKPGGIVGGAGVRRLDRQLHAVKPRIDRH